MSDYNAFSKNLKCKWCGKAIMDHQTDRQCDRCWEVLMRLPDAFRVPELLKEIKRLLEIRMEKIRVEENKETQEILQNPELMKELEQSIEEMRSGNVISLEDAEKESFKEDEN